MSTDRELLEMAAKAIGGTLSEGTGKRRTGPAWDEWEWYGPIGIQTPEGIVIYPLTNDGDALRLAVKLGVQPVPADDRCEARWWGGPLGTTQGSASVITNGDRYTATRRAIFLAAAEIGKAMP